MIPKLGKLSLSAFSKDEINRTVISTGIVWIWFRFEKLTSGWTLAEHRNRTQKAITERVRRNIWFFWWENVCCIQIKLAIPSRQMEGAKNNREVSIDMSGTMENSKPEHAKKETQVQVTSRKYAKLPIELHLLSMYSFTGRSGHFQWVLSKFKYSRGEIFHGQETALDWKACA